MILLAKNQLNEAPKLICDHTLEDTAHWLRAAGYDVQMPFNTLSDKQLLDMAMKSDRLLIINDNNIEDINRHSNQVISVRSNFIYEQLKEVSSNLSIDWTYRPFTRCMICNTELVNLNINQWIDLPAETQKNCVTSHGCPSCNRIYWAGEQVNRMVGQLESFKRRNW